MLRVPEHRDLAFLAGAACGMLGEVSMDLGYPGAAANQFRLALMFADEVGADTLAAWVHAERANSSYWNDQYTRARGFARQGQELNPTGTVAVYLPELEAVAAARLGDIDAARRALDAATDARERVTPSELDEYGGLLSLNMGKQYGQVVKTLEGIGADSDAVAEAADKSVEAYESLPEAERAYDNMTNSRLHAAIAHVRSGELDAAEPYASVALAIAPELRTAQIEKTVRRLHGYLCAPSVRTSAEATDTRDRIEDFLSVSPVHPAIE